MVNLSTDEISKCKKFSEDVLSTNQAKYAKRNQKNPETIKIQITEGKMAELAVEKVLTELNISCTSPDFAIYEKKDKSFDCDLTTDFGSVHVKSMNSSQAKKYDLSFTFQASGWDVDPLLVKPQPNDYLAFVEVNQDYTQGCKLVGLMNINKVLQEKLFKDPKLHQLRGIKTVLYYKDVSHFDKDVLWTCLYEKYKNYTLIIDLAKAGW